MFGSSKAAENEIRNCRLLQKLQDNPAFSVFYLKLPAEYKREENPAKRKLCNGQVPVCSFYNAIEIHSADIFRSVLLV